MTTHSRRAALAVFATAAAATPLLVATRASLAQTAPAPAGDQDYKDYVTKTLTIGTVSLKASQIAAEKATDAMVKEFANLEVAEQTAVATVLSATGAQPPELPADQQAKVQELQDKQAGADFDAAYVQAQIDGHNELLQVQQTISGGNEATVEVITAKLAETEIQTHLAMLKWIQQGMGGAGTTAGSGEQPAQGSQPAAGAAEQAQPSASGGAEQTQQPAGAAGQASQPAAGGEQGSNAGGTAPAGNAMGGAQPGAGAAAGSANGAGAATTPQGGAAAPAAPAQ